jgi:NADH:ubiquinone oxidoreductase subunit 4 (chain M)
MNNYLSLILFTPLIGALVMLFVSKQNENAIRWIANITAFVGFLISVPLWFWYNPQGPEFQFQERLPWIPSIGAEYFIGIDGLSTLLDPADDDDGIHRDPVVVERDHRAGEGVLHLPPRAADRHARRLHGARLHALLPVLGVMLVPMYFLIGIWGSANRLYSAIKFFLYTLVGSVIMLLGILALYFAYHSATGIYTFDITQFQKFTFAPTCSGGCSWPSSAASRSRCRCSRCTPGCPTRIPTRRPPAR